jgi:hypothetical protein
MASLTTNSDRLREWLTRVRPAAWPSRRASAAGLVGLTLSLVPALSAPARAEGERYATAYLCQQAGRLTAQQCANAFANTAAELSEASPRFAARGDCERYFAKCSILDISGRKVTFGPTQQGVEIVGSGGRTMALPVVAWRGPRVDYRPRPVDEKALQVSPKRRVQAQAAWKAQLDAAAAPPAGVDGAVLPPEPFEPFDPDWQKQEGVATYPSKRAGKGKTTVAPDSPPAGE